jgi:hypothetical protein
MAGKIYQFDQLISALAGSVIDAQYIAEQAQLSDLNKFFYERGPTEIEAEIKKANAKAEKAAKKAQEAKEKDLKAEADCLEAEATALKAEADRLSAEARIKQYSPKTVYISFQSARPSAKLGEMDTIRVPLITLVKPVQHSIDEMSVTLNVELGEIRKTERKEDNLKKHPEQKNDWGAYEGKTIIGVSTAPGKQSGAIGTAQVTLKIKAEEPQEGLARLIDNLYKIL